MTVTVFYDSVFAKHDTGAGHPESHQRVLAIKTMLDGQLRDHITYQSPNPVDINWLKLVHDDKYIQRVLSAIPTSGYVNLDGDTTVSPKSGEAALKAAGALVDAVDLVMNTEQRRAFCLVRPPGHHAEPDAAMGFCIFNNVAVGAAYAVHQHHLERVAIVDFDVHHGNGSETMFANQSCYLYVSTHQSPLYPGTGNTGDTFGGSVLNVPLAPSTDSVAYRQAFSEIIYPALEDFEPELIFISAGFDAHKSDPLANLMLDDSDYGWVTEQLVDIAEQSAQGRVISTLEGGYNLNALASSCKAHILALDS